MDRNFYVYAFSRPDGTPCYIGKGKGARWKHDGRCGRNPHLLRIIKNAKAAGQAIIRVKLVEGVTNDEAITLERFFIAAIGREIHGGPLVNLTDGGDGATGYRASEETRAKLRAARVNFRHTPESRAAISAAMKASDKVRANAAKAGRASAGSKKTSGWWSTEEGRAKQRANNPGPTGHEHSEETRTKIKIARAKQPARISPDTEFKPGGVPWNKGKIGIQLSPATQFKKGYQPSDETRARLSASITAAWARRKAAAAQLQIS